MHLHILALCLLAQRHLLKGLSRLRIVLQGWCAGGDGLQVTRKAGRGGSGRPTRTVSRFEYSVLVGQRLGAERKRGGWNPTRGAEAQQTSRAEGRNALHSVTYLCAAAVRSAKDDMIAVR